MLRRNSGLRIMPFWVTNVFKLTVGVAVLSAEPEIALDSTGLARASSQKGQRGVNRGENSLAFIEMRALDIAVAFTLLILFLPVLVLIAALIKLQDGGPALFWQLRLGHGGRRFACFKFRSMVMDAPAKLEAYLESNPAARAEWQRDHKLRNDPRITALGAFLRKSSLDELPQLLNVLRGDMSMVGPRPIVDAEIVRYGRFIRHYCSVRPGITGLWQVSGRNDVSYRRRVAMDVLYVRNHSFRGNLQILAKTVPSVLLRRGSY
jgi:lipopolysaccharide/colanic/teichoic acid biosynthesis glycosyltransferase